MKTKKMTVFLVFTTLMLICTFSHAKTEQFSIRPVSDAEFYKFIKVFSEMRGPLRVEILKDRKTNFEDADPLKYVAKVKDAKDVKKILKEENVSWDQLNELMGNILLGYFSIQPDKTKAGLLKQLSSYGLAMSSDQIPPEYRQVVTDALKTDEGAALASAALEFIVQIPPENVDLAKKNSRQLDQIFYTRFWKDKLN